MFQIHPINRLGILWDISAFKTAAKEKARINGQVWGFFLSPISLLHASSGITEDLFFISSYVLKSSV